eukprot:6473994-Amphidinium_carterae.2
MMVQAGDLMQHYKKTLPLLKTLKGEQDWRIVEGLKRRAKRWKTSKLKKHLEHAPMLQTYADLLQEAHDLAYDNLTTLDDDTLFAKIQKVGIYPLPVNIKERLVERLVDLKKEMNDFRGIFSIINPWGPNVWDQKKPTLAAIGDEN